MKKLVVFSYCEFTRKGMSYIDSCSVLTNDVSKLVSVFHIEKNIENAVMDIQPGAIEILRTIAAFISSGSPIKIIVMVGNAHVPTLRLLRALGVRFILFKGDSLENIYAILNNPALNYYISPSLQSVLEKDQSPPHWTKAWSIFNNVELFTPIETDIILDLCQGKSPWNVGRKRSISIKTVSSHKLHALKKIRMKNLNEIFKITYTKK